MGSLGEIDAVHPEPRGTPRKLIHASFTPKPMRSGLYHGIACFGTCHRVTVAKVGKIARARGQVILNSEQLNIEYSIYTPC